MRKEGPSLSGALLFSLPPYLKFSHLIVYSDFFFIKKRNKKVPDWSTLSCTEHMYREHYNQTNQLN